MPTSSNSRCVVHLSLALAAVALLGSGCRPQPAETKKPEAKPTATPLPIALNVNNLNSTLFEKNGRIIAKVRAAAATAGPGSGVEKTDAVAAASGASAILYEKGVPTATLNADFLNADRDKRVVVGTGNVRLQSLTEPESPAIRADTMTWRYGENVITGKGHVVVTRTPDLRMYGDRFTADTALRKFSLSMDGAPATTGRF